MTIEDELRHVLSDPRRELPGWPDAVARIEAGIRRRRRRGLVTVIAATIASLAVAGGAAQLATGTRPDKPTLPDGVIAWADLPIADNGPVSSPRATATPCRTADLRYDGMDRNGAGGTSLQFVKVVNTGATLCTVTGTPTLLDRHGAAVTVTGTAHQPDPGSGAVPATVAPGEAAITDIETYGGCLDGRKQTVLTGLSLGLADGGRLGLGDLELNTTCGIAVGPWFVEAAPTQPSSPLARLTASIAPTEPVRIGGTLHFIVTIANPTAEPIALRPCPNYSIGLQAAVKAGGVHQLNCVVTEVPAGGSLRFAMEVAIPDYPSTSGEPPYTGTATLAWAMEAGVDVVVSAQVDVTITP